MGTTDNVSRVCCFRSMLFLAYNNNMLFNWLCNTLRRLCLHSSAAETLGYRILTLNMRLAIECYTAEELIHEIHSKGHSVQTTAPTLCVRNEMKTGRQICLLNKTPLAFSVVCVLYGLLEVITLAVYKEEKEAVPT